MQPTYQPDTLYLAASARLVTIRSAHAALARQELPTLRFLADNEPLRARRLSLYRLYTALQAALEE